MNSEERQKIEKDDEEQAVTGCGGLCVLRKQKAVQLLLLLLLFIFNLVAKQLHIMLSIFHYSIYYSKKPPSRRETDVPTRGPTQLAQVGLPACVLDLWLAEV
jgi:hypothetical protein